MPVQGSAAISSDAYFGREQRGGGASGSNVDMTAGDLISKVSITARQDMDSLKQVGGDFFQKNCLAARSAVG